MIVGHEKIVAIHEDASGAEIEVEYDSLAQALVEEGYGDPSVETQRSIYKIERLAQSNLAKDGTLFNNEQKNKDGDLADLSSFRMTNEEARLLGNLARRGYGSPTNIPLGAHAESTWTKVEEIITGFENR